MVEKNDKPQEAVIPVSLIVAIIIIGVIIGLGYLTFNSITGSMTNTAATSNISASIDAGGTMFNMGAAALVMCVVATIVGSTYYFISSAKRYKKASKVVSFIFSTTYYFAWGLLSFVVVAVPSYLLYLTIQYAGEAGGTGALIDVFKWAGIAIAVYFALAALGFVVKKKIVDNFRQRRKEKNDEDIGKGLDKVMG